MVSFVHWGLHFCQAHYGTNQNFIHSGVQDEDYYKISFCQPPLCTEYAQTVK